VSIGNVFKLIQPCPVLYLEPGRPGAWRKPL